ncbi:MAG: chromosomal replication initiator protein DnaA [Cyanobacteria bacterium]|nr:chromosomal replication initiator protein DnaA [Cyanobacteriota bacterium]
MTNTLIEQIANPISNEVNQETSPKPYTKVINQEHQAIWLKVLEQLSKKLRKPSFETWIKPTQLQDIRDDEAIIAVKNDFTRNFIMQTYQKDILEALKEVEAKSMSIRIIIDPELKPIQETNSQVQTSFADLLPNSALKPSNKVKSRLHKKLSFENLAESGFNKASITFARATSLNQSGLYNSLFIQSEPGLGKTHILNAIGNELIEQEPATRIKYCKAEEFTNELIIAIQKHTTQEFRNQYRNLDLLLFDDFHFLENKKTCQEEFLYTFESLVNSGARVIIASQQRLESLNISKNLKNKLKISLMSQINSPNFEDRVSILEIRSKEAGIELSNCQKELIARKYPDSIRELESALFQINAHTCFAGEELDDELISRLFGGIGDQPQHKGLSIKAITDATASYFSLKPKELIGKSRLQDISKSRHIAIFLSYKLLSISYSRIGEYFGGRKHSSIIHSLKVIEQQLSSKLPSASGLRSIIEDIKSQIV